VAHPDYPNAGSYLDRHGKCRWRFRRGKRTVSLPGEPGYPEFDAAYQAALEGRAAPPPATVHRLRTAAPPQSLRAAWRVLRADTLEWKTLGPAIKEAQTRIAERFLEMPIVEKEPLLFGDVAVANLRRKHIKAILARKSDTPHAAAHLLRVIRKLVGVALDQEWIEQDPTYRLKFNPEYGGWKAWPDGMLDKFEVRWPVGSTPRLVYSLALYFGHRRSDVTQVRPADFDALATNIIQQKTGKALEIPIHPNLAEVLAKVDMTREYVVMTQWGKPFSPKALGMRMQKWTEAAGIPPGHTLHGLRKTLGKALAEHGATTRQLMEVLGHDNIEHAELYSREAEQRLLAAAGMEKLANWRRPKGG
jgi:integrase